jgi:hypothetical protein
VVCVKNTLAAAASAVLAGGIAVPILFAAPGHADADTA